MIYCDSLLSLYLAPKPLISAPESLSYRRKLATLLAEICSVYRRKALKKIELFYWVMALTLGSIVGLIDMQAKEVQLPALLVLVFAGIPGYLHPRRAWLWAITIGASILLVHLLAGLFGYTAPYAVEPNVFATLIALIPAFIGAYMGVLLRGITTPSHNT